MAPTQENLMAAFAGESQARNKYTFFAQVARKEGYHYIAKIFEETALNEMRHAKDEFKLAGKLGDTAANLKAAISGEDYETTTMYAEFAEQAEAEGNKEAAILFRMILVETSVSSATLRLLYWKSALNSSGNRSSNAIAVRLMYFCRILPIATPY